MSVQFSQTVIDLIKDCEEWREEAYQCPSGVWTIGWGHTRKARPGMVITEAEGEALLQDDMEEALSGVLRYLEREDLNQNQLDALTSFVFNIGAGNFRTSTVLKQINADAAADQIEFWFKEWKKGRDRNNKKVTMAGLVKRRAREVALYFTPMPGETTDTEPEIIEIVNPEEEGEEAEMPSGKPPFEASERPIPEFLSEEKSQSDLLNESMEKVTGVVSAAPPPRPARKPRSPWVHTDGQSLGITSTEFWMNVMMVFVIVADHAGLFVRELTLEDYGVLATLTGVYTYGRSQAKKGR